MLRFVFMARRNDLCVCARRPQTDSWPIEARCCRKFGLVTAWLRRRPAGDHWIYRALPCCSAIPATSALPGALSVWRSSKRVRALRRALASMARLRQLDIARLSRAAAVLAEISGDCAGGLMAGFAGYEWLQCSHRWLRVKPASTTKAECRLPQLKTRDGLRSSVGTQ